MSAESIPAGSTRRIRLRTNAAPALRRMVLGGAAALSRLVDPAVLAAGLLRGAHDRDRTTRRAIIRLAALTEPAPADVVTGYLGGLALLGVASGTDVRYAYRRVEQRSVITAGSKRVSPSMTLRRRREALEVRFDHDFHDVVVACRRDEASWITPEIIALYDRVHALGFAASVGVYRDGRLVGGSWGLLVGRTFCVMSTFYRANNAGMVAQLAIMDELGPAGRWDLIDMTEHRSEYERFGAFCVTEEEARGLVLANLGPGRAAGTSGAETR